MSVAERRSVYGGPPDPGALPDAPDMAACRALALDGGLGHALSRRRCRAGGGRHQHRAGYAPRPPREGRAPALRGGEPVSGATVVGDLSHETAEAGRLRPARAELRERIALAERETRAARARPEALAERSALEAEAAGVEGDDHARPHDPRHDGRIAADRLADARRGVPVSSTRELRSGRGGARGAAAGERPGRAARGGRRLGAAGAGRSGRDDRGARRPRPRRDRPARDRADGGRAARRPRSGGRGPGQGLRRGGQPHAAARCRPHGAVLRARCPVRPPGRAARRRAAGAGDRQRGGSPTSASSRPAGCRRTVPMRRLRPPWPSGRSPCAPATAAS